MSRSLNKVMLIGNVGADPEIRRTQSGTKVANLSLATSRRIPRGDEWEEATDWHRLTVWDRLADVVEQYVQKGDRLYAEGTVEYGSYERDGQTIHTTSIVVRELIMLGAAGSGTSGS